MKIENINQMFHNHWKNVVSNDSMRPVMTGVYFDLVNGKMVATNSHILLECPIDIIWEGEEQHFGRKYQEEKLQEQSKIVPLEFFDRSKYMGDYKSYSGTFFYDFSDEKYARVLLFNEVIFKCKYIDGKFPNYKAAYPTEKNHLEGIGANIEMIDKIYKSIPFNSSNKNLFFEFCAKNRGIVFKSKYCEGFQGILMPVIES